MKSVFYCCVLVLASWTLPCLATDDCDRCEGCGCAANCCKVCRCVPSTKKVTKVTYSVECEDFCVPGKSDRSVACDECGHKKHVYTPTCAQVHTRRNLIKHETVKEVPTTKWVVENLCHECVARCAAQQGESADVARAKGVPEPATLPAAPMSVAAETQDNAGRRVKPAASLKADLGRAIPALFRQE